MAFALKGAGSASTANSATANQASFVITTATTAGASGDLAVVCYAVDNSVTGDGDEGAVTAVTDSGGNSWSKAVEFTNGQGTSQAGATCGIWYSNLTAALAIGGTVTLTFHTAAARDASAANLTYFTKAAGMLATVEAKAVLANDAAAAGSLNATTANIACLRIRAIATESATTTALTPTATFAVLTQAVATTAMAIRGEYLISTATGQASAPTGGVAAVDHASVYVAFKEAAKQVAVEATKHVNASSTSVAVSSFVTTRAPGQIIVVVGTNAASVTSVTASGLTFTQRKISANGSVTNVAIYTAPYTSNFSGTITVTIPTAVFCTVDVMAVTGVSSVSGIGAPPFDANASLPAASTGGAATGTTTSASDFVFAVAGGAGSNNAATAPWSMMPGSGAADFVITEYQIVQAAGSFTAAVAASPAGSVVDALVAAPAVTNYTMPADAGTIALSGQTAVLREANRLPVPAQGVIALSGQTAALRDNNRLPVPAAGVIAASGQTVGLRTARRLAVPAQGTLTAAGQTVTLTRTTAAGTRLDPAKTSSLVTLSNSNRTATRSSGTAYYASTLSDKSANSTVNAFLHVETTNTASLDSGIGVSNAVLPDSPAGVADWLGWDTNSIGLYKDQIWYNSVQVGTLATVPNPADVIAFEIHRGLQQVWYRNVTKNEAWWPSLSTGYSIGSLASGTLYFGFSLGVSDAKTVNFDGVFADDTIFSPIVVRWDGTPIPAAAGAGSIVISGQTAALRHAYRLVAGTGTLALSGQTAVLREARKLLVPVQGTITAAGQTAILRFGHKFPALNGTLTLSGQTATLKRSYVMPAGLGTLTLSGWPVGLTLVHKLVMPASLGTLTAAGQAITLRYTRVFPLTQGTLTAAGQTVTLRYARRPAAGLGTLTLAGQTAGLRYGHVMAAGTGTLTLAGQLNRLAYKRTMAVTQGTIVVSGQTVNLISSSNPNKSLPAGVGQLTLAGQTVGCRAARVMTAGTGALTLSGQNVSLREAHRLAVPAQGTLTLAGQAVTLRCSHSMAAALGTLTLNGQPVGLPRKRVMPVTTGTITLFGPVVNLISSSSPNKLLPAGVGVVRLSGQDAGFRFAHVLTAGQGTLTLTGQIAGLRGFHKLSIGTGTLTINGQPVAFVHTGPTAARMPAETSNVIFFSQWTELRYVPAPPPFVVSPPPSRRDYSWHDRGPGLHKRWHRR